MDGNAQLGGLIIGFVFSVFVFFITREIWCWYFKINAAITELRFIRVELEKANTREDKKAAANAPTAFAPSSDGYAPIP